MSTSLKDITHQFKDSNNKVQLIYAFNGIGKTRLSREIIAADDYNLSVNSYVEAKDNREVVNITQLNAELKTTAEKINHLRSEVNDNIAEIEGSKVKA